MKKKILLTFIMVALSILVFGTVSVSADTSGYYTYTVSNGEATITDCNNQIQGGITIPNTLGGYPVTSIGSDAFYYCTRLTSITIPNSVTSIGSTAFRSCTDLGIVTIGNGVEKIGTNAFSGCTRLTKVNITDISSWCKIKFTASSNPLYYAKKLYHNYKLVTDLVIPNDVTEINDYAFYMCESLTSVTISDSVTSIGSSAFYYCKNLSNITVSENNQHYTSVEGVLFNKDKTTLIRYPEGKMDKNAAISDSITSIGASAFYNCSSLTSITIPENVLTIGTYAFYNCKAVTQINWNAKKVSDFSMDNHTFEYVGKNGNGVNVIFGNNVESIPANVFSPYKYSGYAPKITNVTIGNRVTTIGSRAFSFCVDLKSIFIPKSVTEISSSAFSECTNIEKVNIEDIGAWCTINFEFGSSSNPLYYAEKLYLNNELITELIIPDGVEKIGRYAFYNCTSLTSVSIPNSVTSIGDCAFYGCTGLTSVVISENTITIGSSAFRGCSGLTSITIPDNVTTIGSSAFRDCSGLTSITIPDNVTTIEGYAFYGCTGLTDLTIGENVSSIGDNAFEDCHHLTQINWNAKYVYDFSMDSEVFSDAGDSEDGIVVIFGNEVESIPDWAFSSLVYNTPDGTKITKVIMGDKLRVVGFRAFGFCSALEEVVFGSGLEQIEGAAFMSCKNLKSITLPETLTTINNGVFRYCSALEEITWNAKNIDADSFGTFVFSDCGNTEKGILLTFGENVENIPDNLFYREDSGYVKPQIKSVIIGNNLKAIPEKLFRGMSSLTSITIPDTAIVIGDSAFEDCGYYNNSENWDNGYLYINNHLISTDKTIASAAVREGTITIAGGAFEENTELLKITLPDTVEIISDYAFSNCNNLLKITIPENVSYIGKYAFSGCGNLTKINIPSTVTKIGEYAFRYCDSLEGVYITDINAWCKIEFLGNFDYWDGCSNPLYTAGKLYINDELAENITISADITDLHSNLFANCDSIKSVVLPESLTTIGANAFYDCDNLISINIPASVTSIGYDAFDDCWDLENVYITDLSAWCTITFEDIEQNPLRSGAYLYLNGERLEDLVIPEDITVVGNYTFYNCDSIKSVVLHDNVEKIEESVFYDCDSLKYVVIPEDILYIKNNAFYGCYNISYVFFKGSQALWDDMLIYSGNDPLNDATVICNAKEKIYKFETNCDSKLSDITTYCLTDAPKPYNEKQVLTGWYDNATLSGDAIAFPYYGDATTLYAAWSERTGTSFDDAIYLKENKTNIKYVDAWDYVYYEFVPQFSGQYRFYATGSNNVYINLYSQDRNYIGYTNNGEYLSYDYFEAGTIYYLSIRSDIATELSFTIETDLTIGTSSKVSQDGKSFTVTVNGIPYGKTIILALYDGNKFVGMQSATYIGNEIYFTTTEKYTNAKVMVWDNFTKLKPVCDVEIVK